MYNFKQHLSESTKFEIIKQFGTADLWQSFYASHNMNYSKFRISNDDVNYLWLRVSKYFEYGKHDETIYDAFETLLSYKEIFPKFLKPNSIYAFRGLKRTTTELDQMNLKWKEFDKDWMVAKGTYTNKTGVSSWTIKEHIAWGFATIGDAEFFDNMNKVIIHLTIFAKNSDFSKSNWNEIKLPVLMQAKVDKDFLFNTSFSNKISRQLVDAEEYEILRASKSSIPVEYFIWKGLLNK